MSKLRLLAKKIPGLKTFYRSFVLPIRTRIYVWQLYRYDYQRILKYGGHIASRESLIAYITMTYHVIEKGLTMKSMRPGFGKDKVLSLISSLLKYAEAYDINNVQFRHGVAVVAEYKVVHQELDFKLEEELIATIDKLIEKCHIAPSCQIEITREEYYSKLNAPFVSFSETRHSVRSLSGSISNDQIFKAISIANNAPSACNRQPWRVHLISDKGMAAKCLSYQNGNRGFGDLADKLLVVTADVRASWPAESLDVRTNAGIYLMNLCYALHSQKVAHCLLNWFAPPIKDISLRNLLNLHPAETVVALVVCGDVPEKFKLAASPRKTVDETLVIH